MGWARRAVVGTLAGTLFLTAACGGAPGKEDGERSGQGDKDTSAIGDAMDAKATGPAPKVKGAQEGGTLTLLTGNSPDSIDPTRVNYLDMMETHRLISRTLTGFRYDAESGNMVLVPDMATDLGRPNEDFTKWEFTLKDGLKYDNGEPVTAQDVAYAVKRQFAQEELPGGPTYSLDVLKDGDKYLGPFEPAKKDADGKYGGADFPGVKATDDKTIVFNTRLPYPDWRYTVALPAFTAIPKKHDTRIDYEKGLRATGPYKVKSYTPQKRLVLERNEHWDAKTDPIRHQYLDGYDFRLSMDDQTVQKQMVADNGSDKNAMTWDNVLATDYGQSIKGKEPEKRLVEGRDPCVEYVYFDTRKIPLEVRKALATAWPLDQESKVAGDILGLTYEPSLTLMPSTTPGFTGKDPLGRKGKGPGDPDKAKQMLKEAGKVDFPITYHYINNDPVEQKISLARKDALEKAGFKVKTIGLPEEQVRAERDKVESPVNVRDGSWCPDWPSGGSILPATFDGRKMNQPGAPNPSFLNKKDVNEEMDRISTLPPEKGIKAWGELDAMIMKKYVPAIPTNQGGSGYLHGSNVGNVNHDEVRGNPDLTGVYLKQ